MGFITFSILIASFTFLCFRHPPSSWTWLRRSPPLSPNVDESPESTPLTQGSLPSHDANPSTKSKEIHTQPDEDRKAMPPPPTPGTSLSTPKVPISIPDTQVSRTTARLPQGEKSSTAASRPPVPAFPAVNSPQRAAGSFQSPASNPLPRVQPPLRSVNSLTPPSTLLPLPNRSPYPSTSLSALPIQGLPANTRKKVLLTPGHSPLDWAMLSKAPDVNLRGLPPSTPYLKVPPSLLRQHTGRKGKDAWTVLGGKVYNISPYLPYHPGGAAELMKAAGRDGTRLFTEIHSWVNWETMLDACLIGIAIGDDEITSNSHLDDMD